MASLAYEELDIITIGKRRGQPIDLPSDAVGSEFTNVLTNALVLYLNLFIYLFEMK